MMTNGERLAARFSITAYPGGGFHVADREARCGTDRMGCNLPDEAAVIAWCLRTLAIDQGRI